MMVKTIRSFFALPISAVCKHEINALILDLKKIIPIGVRWICPENLHITLKFIGRLNPNDIPKIKSELEVSLSQYNNFEISFQKLGVFPELGQPRIIWIGISPLSPIQSLFNSIKNAALLAGYSTETRDFLPHVTIGRIKFFEPKKDLTEIRQHLENRKSLMICTTRIKSVVLYQSQLTPTGPIYSALVKINLRT